MHILETLSVQFGSMNLAPHPSVSLNLQEVPDNFNILSVFNYQVWANNLDGENDDEEALLELGPGNMPHFSQFPKIPSGLYYIHRVL